MQQAPSTPRQRKLDIGLGALAVFTIASAGAALAWDSQPTESAAEPRYTPPTIEATEDKRPTALFVGDSYTAGAGVSSTGYKWATQAARELGWEEQNIGSGGTGYKASVDGGDARNACGDPYCPAYPEAVEGYDGPAPDIVVIAGGRNDRNTPADQYRAAVETTLSDATGRFPGAKVYVVSPVWDDDPAPASFQPLAQIIREEAGEVGAEFVDIGQPLEGKADLIGKDSVHPNNEGHAALAEAFTKAVS